MVTDAKETPPTTPASASALAISAATLWQQWYPAHLQVLLEQWHRLAEEQQLDVLVLPAGKAALHSFDDQPVSFRLNPHFARWLPLPAGEGSVLILHRERPPQLLFFRPLDYWHQPPELPDWFPNTIVVHNFADENALQRALADTLRNTGAAAVIGPLNPYAVASEVARNPPKLLAALHFERALKTPFEQACLLRANQRAACGHLAAAAAFNAGLAAAATSEYLTHQAYLLASEQTDDDLPYRSIVAFNDHGAMLHYQQLQRDRTTRPLSLLIDAGATWACYGSDITRTYAAHDGLFKHLIEAVDREQLALIEGIAPGQSFLHLHTEMHQRITRILCEADLLCCGPEEAQVQGLSQAFFPHGLGHLLGLQTHDVGGLFRDASGVPKEPPERYAALRLTRLIEPGFVFTVEPGIYFIDQLLAPIFQQRGSASHLNQALIKELKGYGGIRIEDNVVVTHHGSVNLTRHAFADPKVHSS